MSDVNEWDLTGEVAVITCDRRGWTPSLAIALSDAGASVVVVGATTSDMYEAVDVVSSNGGRGLALQTDLTNGQEVNNAIHEVVSEFGKIDILVNNARVEFGQPFLDVKEAEWNEVINFNVNSVFLCSQAVGKYMLKRGRGRIVNICSVLAVRGLANSVAACAAQGAVGQITKALALEWASHNVRVNGIGTGWMDNTIPPVDLQLDRLGRFIPLLRKGHPSDIGELLVYLASDACDFVTGHTVYVDGGVTSHA